jgi:hypothetical protein
MNSQGAVKLTMLVIFYRIANMKQQCDTIGVSEDERYPTYIYIYNIAILIWEMMVRDSVFGVPCFQPSKLRDEAIEIAD